MISFRDGQIREKSERSVSRSGEKPKVSHQKRKRNQKAVGGMISWALMDLIS